MQCNASTQEDFPGFVWISQVLFGYLGEFTEAAKKLTKLLHSPKFWGLGDFFLGEFPEAPSVSQVVRVLSVVYIDSRANTYFFTFVLFCSLCRW